jgi:hypothetical protein
MHLQTKSLQNNVSAADSDLDTAAHVGPQHYVRFRRLRLLDERGNPTTTYAMNKPFVAQFELECTHRMTNAEIGLKISSRFGPVIHYLSSSWEGLTLDLEAGRHQFQVVLPKVLLFPGSYFVGLWALRPPDLSAGDDNIHEAAQFNVIKGDITGYPTRVEYYNDGGFAVYTPSLWSVTALEHAIASRNDELQSECRG